jgi:hypothetical protein
VSTWNLLVVVRLGAGSSGSLAHHWATVSHKKKTRLASQHGVTCELSRLVDAPASSSALLPAWIYILLSVVNLGQDSIFPIRTLSFSLVRRIPFWQVKEIHNEQYILCTIIWVMIGARPGYYITN